MGPKVLLTSCCVFSIIYSYHSSDWRFEIKYKIACAKPCKMQQELSVYISNRSLWEVECHCVHVREKGVEKQSDSVTQEVADAVCGEVRTEMMLLEHLYSCEFILPDGNLCAPPKACVITLTPD